MSQDKVIIVSLDGHAQMPVDVWPDYLEKRYHEHLPTIYQENAWFSEMMTHFNDYTMDASNMDAFDPDHVVRNGGKAGLYKRDVRLQEMDREGIAAEYIHSGDNTFCGLFYQSSNQDHPQHLCMAGAKGYNRWLYDEFGRDTDRLKLIGILGSAPWRTMDEMLAELDWIAERGFAATTLPGFVTYPGMPPLFDRYWDPFWARVEEYGLALWMHAGQGERQGELGVLMKRINDQIRKETGDDGDMGKVVKEMATQFLKGKVFSSVKPRRAMWQLMMGGVFDRFPKLRLVLSEIYGDWMPAVMTYLDRQYEQHRDKLPATRKPSEYWESNGINGLSFIRKCEVAVRHEIGIGQVAFGRDYPHAEGTWPNTDVWLRDALGHLPEEEVRGILGENVIRVLGLDRPKLAAIAERIGPSIEAITGPGAPPKPEMLAHFHHRAFYAAEGEGDTRIGELEPLMAEDLWKMGAEA